MRRHIEIYHKINPNSFIHNVSPIPVTFRASNDRSDTNWGFNAPLNKTAQEYLDQFYNKKNKYWDLSLLVIGAKPNTFRMYQNSIEQDEKIITQSFVKKNPIIFTEEQRELYDDLFTIRKTLDEYRYKNKYIGWTWNLYSKHQKKFHTFEFPEDLDKYLNHYRNIKSMVENYAKNKNE